MTNTFGLTDYDVYVDEDNDNFIGRLIATRHIRKRLRKRRRKKKARQGQFSRAFQVKRRPKIIKGHFIKRPPIVIRKGLPIVPLGDSTKKQSVKPILIKKKPKLVIKPKTPISHLIKKSTPRPIKPSLSEASIKEVKAIKTVEDQTKKQTKQSNNKVSKVVKVVAVVGMVGVTGFGIYKFIQNKNKINGHISTSK